MTVPGPWELRPRESTARAPSEAPVTGAEDVCDICGMAAVVERKCKVICLNCHTILKSCADL